MIQTTNATDYPNLWSIFDCQDTCGTATTFSPFTLLLEGGKCVCCGELAQTKLGKYWAHPECTYKTAELIRQAEIEIPRIRLKIIMSSRKCLEASILSIGRNPETFNSIRRDVENKAWKIFKEHHPTPWIVRKDKL